ncbi:MAG: glycosyltransferase [Sandaracinaceae bacterium]|nr:glycosyltransferase [Sandaracinaceae bacterium]
MRGKCAFKMIQYMAAGRPAVGSAVGANIALLAGTSAGALVAPEGDWWEALRPYVEDAALRRTAGEAARDRVVAAYSIRAVLDTYLQLFQRLVSP